MYNMIKGQMYSGIIFYLEMMTVDVFWNPNYYIILILFLIKYIAGELVDMLVYMLI